MFDGFSDSDTGAAPVASTFMGTPLYEMAVELAEQFTDDFQRQEEFIEGVLIAYILVTQDS